MADIVFNEDILRYIRLFEQITHTRAKDCMEAPDRIIFIVGPNMIGQAVGKSGTNINQLKDITKKNVQIIEFSDDPVRFIKNIFRNYSPKNVEFEERGEVTHATVTVDPASKARAIGKEGRNLKVAREILIRHHNIQSLSVS